MPLGDHPVSKSELLGTLAPEWPGDVSVDLRKRIAERRRKLVVLDDDPTGAQAMHSAPVLTRWTADVVETALLGEASLFFIVSNTRSQAQAEAVRVTEEIVEVVSSVADDCGVAFDVLVRGDSTLRGHYPHELNTVRDVLVKRGQHFDGVILCPFFAEGGRLTVHDVQWVVDEEQCTPAGLTEYARDRAFSYTHSNLRDWVEEKTLGTTLRSDVISVSLDVIRQEGPEGVCDVLMSVKDGKPVVVNAVTYRDLEVFLLGLLDAEDAGKRFLYRTSASFLKVRSGVAERGLLRGQDFGVTEGQGGLVMVGSYIQKSTLQLEAALALSNVLGVELQVKKVLHDSTCEAEVLRVVEVVEHGLEAEKDVIVFTSRDLDLAGDLAVGKRIAQAWVTFVNKLSIRPKYVVIKGGNTAISVVRDGLQSQQAWALGQILPGVPVWRLADQSLFPNLPCVVFPGNVGQNDSLVMALEILHEASDGT